MRVAILTTLSDFNPSYSLTSVVEAQLVSLVKYGYEAVLFVHDNFKGDVPAGVEVRKTVPRFQLEDYSGHQQVNADYNRQVQEAYKAFKDGLKDIDVVFTVDLIFQGWFLPYCEAIHKLAKETEIKWFHWIHSTPNLMPKGLAYPHTLRYHLPNNSKLVYLNNQNIIRAAESYSIFPKDVRIVYNPVDPRLFWNLDPFVKRMIDSYEILEADFMQVYPVSSTRMVDGKQVDTVIDIFSKLKAQGNKVCLVIANAHANAEREKQTIEALLQRAEEKGLQRTELVFTSLEEGGKYELGVPRSVVSQLFQLSNLFIFPTVSENCPLILLEAMLSKTLLVLNEDVPVLKEFAREDALYFKFGSLDTKTEWSDKERFLNDVAKIIVSEFSTNRALKASRRIRKQFNYDILFKQQIEPLLYND